MAFYLHVFNTHSIETSTITHVLKLFLTSKLEFFRAPFLVLHFFCYTLITFLIMLSIILLSMFMILLSVLSVIRHLICGSNLNWLLDLNLMYEKLWTGVRSGLLISMLRKLSWFRFASGLITMVLVMWKWLGALLRNNHLLRFWGWLSPLNWIGVLSLSLLLKLPPKKLEFQFVLRSFFHLRLFCISINLRYTHVWNAVITSGILPLVATWNC